MRVVLDTNVWISAQMFGGQPQRIIELGTKRRLTLVTSVALLAELDRVLERKFLLSLDKRRRLLAVILSYTDLVVPTEKVSVIARSHPDNRVLECALAAQADAIVTGDKAHLLPLRAFRQIPILTPAKFLRRYARTE